MQIKAYKSYIHVCSFRSDQEEDEDNLDHKEEKVCTFDILMIFLVFCGDRDHLGAFLEEGVHRFWSS